jgi:hypothetical protein
MFDVMGFGSPPGEVPPLLQPGVLSMAWGSAIRAMADGLGITLDGVTDSCELEPAPEAFDITAGRIPKGGLAAIRFEVSGMVDGRAVLVVEHVTRLREDLRPDWAQPGQPGGSYRIEIVGEPAYRVEVLQTSKWGDCGGRGPDRQRHPGGGSRPCRRAHRTGPPIGHRKWFLRCRHARAAGGGCVMARVTGELAISTAGRGNGRISRPVC